MFQSNHVLHYMWNVEFSPIKDGDRSRQGRGLVGGGGGRGGSPRSRFPLESFCKPYSMSRKSYFQCRVVQL